MAFEQALGQAQAWAETYMSVEAVPDDKLPKVYDFRNIGGHDFTQPIRS